MKSRLLVVGALLLLATLGVMLYFSAAGYLNVFALPLLQSVSDKPSPQMIAAVLVIISFLGALIAGFFSVFLFEMAGGGYRPLLMGFLFSLPVILIRVSLLWNSNSSMQGDIAMIYALESLVVLVAYVLMAWMGRWVFRRFFSGEIHPA
ncbi:hypothetical protein [Thiolapillus sp.]